MNEKYRFFFVVENDFDYSLVVFGANSPEEYREMIALYNELSRQECRVLDIRKENIR